MDACLFLHLKCTILMYRILFIIFYNRIKKKCISNVTEFDFVEDPFQVSNPSEEIKRIQNSPRLANIFKTMSLYQFWISCNEV